MTQEPTTFTEQLTEFISYKRYPSLWDRMTDEHRAIIMQLGELKLKEFCIEFLTRNQFYTNCTFNEIQSLLIALGQYRSLANFQNLFADL
jgi:hypothetical protein